VSTRQTDHDWVMPLPELERRRDGVLRWMDAHNVSVIAVTDPENLVYLTGIDIGGRTGGKAMLLAADGRHRFVTRLLERYWQGHWQDKSWCRDWAFYEDTQTLAQALAHVAAELCGKPVHRLGLELSRPWLSAADAHALADAAAHVIDVAPCIVGLRRIKSRHEIQALRRAGELSVQGAVAAAEVIKNHGRESDAVAAAFAALIDGAGAQAPVSSPHVVCGARTAMAHNAWTHAAPRAGDSVVFVMTGTCERYCTPIEWTVVKSEISPQKARILDVCNQAGRAVMEGLRPGMSAHQGDMLCRRVIREAGLANDFMNRAAYGIGLSFVSWMESLVQLKPGDDSEILPGMTMHLVPAFHMPEHGFMIRTIAFEVTQTGCASLRPPLPVDDVI